ncbi:MAG: hypothetical protein JWR32_1937 [Mycobacterium sp.]|jgi:hypothetical protein|nr:hypothetical protein [Mycobacterium sp.]
MWEQRVCRRAAAVESAVAHPVVDMIGAPTRRDQHGFTGSE